MAHTTFDLFDKALNKVLLNLAKRVVADGEGASKFISIKIDNCNIISIYIS